MRLVAPSIGVVPSGGHTAYLAGPPASSPSGAASAATHGLTGGLAGAPELVGARSVPSGSVSVSERRHVS